MGNINLVPG
ncbi:rCG55747 [Rattus norvegicus]|uniref:RCG55747 n=1 Tax=Rattus norvegicus TaxID=10116 RepID=A6JM86_RAT|nr:rCG55747 [Rattus norvegicus]